MQAAADSGPVSKLMMALLKKDPVEREMEIGSLPVEQIVVKKDASTQTDPCCYEEAVNEKPEDKCYLCEVCQEKFSDNKDLFSHLYVHPTTCGICKKSYNRRDNFKRHILTHVGKTHFCTVCQKSFARSDHLSNHMKVHKDQAKHEYSAAECKICFTNFITRQKLVEHIGTHLEEAPFVCGICEKEFSERVLIEEHIPSHSDHQSLLCKVCLLTFTSESSLNGHMLSGFCQLPYGIQIKEGQNLNKSDCYEFKRGVVKYEEGLVAVKTGKLNEDNGQNDRYEESTSSQKVSCQICSQEFIEHTYLFSHFDVHINICPYKCGICGKIFKRKEHLKRHLIIHSGLRAFHCSICSKSFSRSDNLSKHVKTHSIGDEGDRVDEVESPLEDSTLNASLDQESMDDTIAEDLLVPDIEFSEDPNGQEILVSGQICGQELPSSRKTSNQEMSVLHETSNEEMPTSGEHSHKEIPILSNDLDQETPVSSVSDIKMPISNDNLNQTPMLRASFDQEMPLPNDNLSQTPMPSTSFSQGMPILNQISEGVLTSGEVHEQRLSVIEFRDLIEGKTFEEIVNDELTRDDGSDSRLFCCKVCQKPFNKDDLDNLYDHMEIHSDLSPFKCGICEKILKRKEHLKRHMLTHTGQREFHCNLCERSFSRSDNLGKHMKVHAKYLKEPRGELTSAPIVPKKPKQIKVLDADTKENVRLTCGYCNETYEDRNSLDQHLKAHLGGYPFTCSICHKIFTQKAHLYKHVKTFVGHCILTCHICELSFPRKNLLETHILKHSMPPSFCCKFCYLTFTSKQTLEKHELDHHPIKDVHSYISCDAKKKEFTETSNESEERDRFKEAKLLIHEHSPAIASVENVKSEESYKTNEDSSPDLAQSTSIEKGVEIEDATFRSCCKICDTTFFDYSSLLEHVKTHYIEHESLKCGICGKMKRNYCILLEHLLSHSTSTAPNIN